MFTELQSPDYKLLVSSVLAFVVGTCSSYVDLELCLLNQLEDQAISIHQLLLDGKPSPSSTEPPLHCEVQRVGLVIILIHQGDHLVTLGQILPAEMNRKAQPEAPGDMGLGHGLDEDGEAGVQLLLQILRLRDGVAPRIVGRVHPVGQISSHRSVRPPNLHPKIGNLLAVHGLIREVGEPAGPPYWLHHGVGDVERHPRLPLLDQRGLGGGGGLSDGSREVVELQLLQLPFVRLHLPPPLLLVRRRFRHLSSLSRLCVYCYCCGYVLVFFYSVFY
uniref:Uncharacterized protein n=1 Tax=Zea mays TaxID=4577 RepID=C0PB07_MAIZE|nr:unknown [Zea mays]